MRPTESQGFMKFFGNFESACCFIKIWVSNWFNNNAIFLFFWFFNLNEFRWFSGQLYHETQKRIGEEIMQRSLNFSNKSCYFKGTHSIHANFINRWWCHWIFSEWFFCFSFYVLSWTESNFPIRFSMDFFFRKLTNGCCFSIIFCAVFEWLKFFPSFLFHILDSRIPSSSFRSKKFYFPQIKKSFL